MEKETLHHRDTLMGEELVVQEEAGVDVVVSTMQEKT